VEHIFNAEDLEADLLLAATLRFRLGG
jgi:hypothetical protein